MPGIPAAWAALSRRFGRLPLTAVLEPAIKYASEGYPVSPIVAVQWKIAYDIYKSSLKGEIAEAWFETFAPKGRAPEPGEIWSSRDHAETLRAIAETEAEAFYRGDTGRPDR